MLDLSALWIPSGVRVHIKLKANPTRAEFDESNFALQNTLKKCGAGDKSPFDRLLLGLQHRVTRLLSLSSHVYAPISVSFCICRIITLGIQFA